MNNTDDLDMALRDAVGPDAPAGISSRAVRRTMLKVEELDQRRMIRKEQEAHIHKISKRSANMLHQSANRDRVPQIRLVSCWYLASPIGISRPL